VTTSTKSPPNQAIRPMVNSRGHQFDVFVTGDKGGEQYHSTPQRIYDLIDALYDERLENGKPKYNPNHVARLATFYAFVKSKYGWLTNSPAKLSRADIASKFRFSEDSAGDLVEVARQAGLVIAERHNRSTNGQTRTRGYYITPLLLCTSKKNYDTLLRATAVNEERAQARMEEAESTSSKYQAETTSTTDAPTSTSVRVTSVGTLSGAFTDSATASLLVKQAWLPSQVDLATPPLSRLLSSNSLGQKIGTSSESVQKRVGTSSESVSTELEPVPAVNYLDSYLLERKDSLENETSLNSQNEKTSFTDEPTKFIKPKQLDYIASLLKEKRLDSERSGRHLRQRYGVSRLDALTSSDAVAIINGLRDGSMGAWLLDQTRAEQTAERKKSEALRPSEPEAKPLSRDEERATLEAMKEMMRRSDAMTQGILKPLASTFTMPR